MTSLDFDLRTLIMQIHADRTQESEAAGLLDICVGATMANQCVTTDASSPLPARQSG